MSLEELKRNPKVLDQIISLCVATILLILFFVISQNNDVSKFIGFFLLFLILIVFSVIYYFLFKNELIKKTCLKFLRYSIFFIVLVVFILLFFNLVEGKGQNNTPYEIKFDTYIVGNATTIEEFNRDLIESNKIWGNYNITLKSNEVFFVNEINDSEKTFLANVNASNETECSGYNQIISFSNRSELRVIILQSKSINQGRACICGCNSVIIDTKKELYMDLTGWNIAHEFGHFFGLIDMRNRYNLMCDQFKAVKSDFLNKKQVALIDNRLNELFNPTMP